MTRQASSNLELPGWTVVPGRPGFWLWLQCWPCTGTCSKPCSAHHSDRPRLSGHRITQGAADRCSRLTATSLAVRQWMLVPCVYHPPVFCLPSSGGGDGTFVVQKRTPQYMLLAQGSSANERSEPSAQVQRTAPVQLGYSAGSMGRCFGVSLWKEGSVGDAKKHVSCIS